ncbi:glycosyltransferase family 2 protein [Emticicia agri]|uniref:Glycosyltransferase family 2 protein n=1 Tax=Emticicia agri TaxID=2492393 RepID=A0A4Q5LVL4_9BACT|nr:glycosyltransferase family 2 protein [Emticicia agri]RYU93722.1 glycosyltransferase family 2 protein [Emticicia agri]
MKEIAILMTCYNRVEKTINCLRALYNCYMPNGYSIEVFLVDDGSTDGTSAQVKELYSSVNIVQGTGSLYWNRGMYLAWKTAIDKKNYDYYLWLNDDTILFPHAINELILCTNNENILTCGAICFPSTKEFTYGGRSIKGEKIIPNGEIQNCYMINGNCVLISNKIVSYVGLLDPIYPHAIGDFEYGLRALKSGFEIITTRTYVGECENHSTLPQWCYSYVPFLKRLKSLYSPLGNSHPKYFFIFEKKYFGFFTALKHFISIHLRVLVPSLWK